MTERDDILQEAIKIAGGLTGLARACGGISAQAIQQWRRVPIQRVADVERATGIPRERLRPDIFVQRA